ncbi:hypothetical protein HKD37_19G054017 [Glycine soja]|uniref:Uncharacterized protein n=1 Tax=Glycine soja TaxID=3848 RepID=A0A0B2PMG4_GLYSO|nr:hypothetical protein JHK85_054234 [Glycine max]KHN08909.1 hypothetical protein glysoja_029486 [Glycine soja]
MTNPQKIRGSPNATKPLIPTRNYRQLHYYCRPQSDIMINVSHKKPTEKFIQIDRYHHKVVN